MCPFNIFSNLFPIINIIVLAWGDPGLYLVTSCSIFDNYLVDTCTWTPEHLNKVWKKLTISVPRLTCSTPCFIPESNSSKSLLSIPSDVSEICSVSPISSIMEDNTRKWPSILFEMYQLPKILFLYLDRCLQESEPLETFPQQLTWANHHLSINPLNQLMLTEYTKEYIKSSLHHFLRIQQKSKQTNPPNSMVLLLNGGIKSPQVDKCSWCDMSWGWVPRGRSAGSMKAGWGRVLKELLCQAGYVGKDLMQCKDCVTTRRKWGYAEDSQIGVTSSANWIYHR